MDIGSAIALCLILSVLAFLGGIVLRVWLFNREQRTLFHQLRRHFAPTPLDELTVTDREFPARIRPDLQRCLEQFFGKRCRVRQLSGVRYDDAHFGISLPWLFTPNNNAVAVPLEYQDVNVGGDEPVRCVQSGLWVLEADAGKAVLLVSQVVGFRNIVPHTRVAMAVENTPAGQAMAKELFLALETAAREASHYRGKILSLEPEPDYRGQSTGFNVCRVPVVCRQEVVLPERTLELLERNVVQFVAQRDRLAQLGQSTKKGLLFHGPPGNGKTLTIRYLLGQLHGHTTLLITADQMGELREFMALARLLQPAVVVIEDVDLIARAREELGSACQESLLNRLLNEMDGLKEDSRTLFILTTNRPQQLEEALSARPGRIDQAIEFPRPDVAGRARLARLYARSAVLPDELAEAIAARTEGASGAFMKELMRRALQFRLAERGDEAIDLAGVERAIEEMTTGGWERPQAAASGSR